MVVRQVWGKETSGVRPTEDTGVSDQEGQYDTVISCEQCLNSRRRRIDLVPGKGPHPSDFYVPNIYWHLIEEKMLITFAERMNARMIGGVSGGCF